MYRVAYSVQHEAGGRSLAYVMSIILQLVFWVDEADEAPAFGPPTAPPPPAAA